MGKTSPWMPEQDRVRLAVLGKLLEELGEAAQRAARCITHGIDEIDPDTKRSNREELRRELTDVEACILQVRVEFEDTHTMHNRYFDKNTGFDEWHKLIRENEAK